MSGVKRSGTSGRKVHHAGDLIALGSKSSSSKSSLRHPGSDDDLTKAPKQSSSTVVAPAKKFKPSPSGENTGNLFSDPIRVSQVSQLAGTSGKQSSSSKGSHGSSSPQPGIVSGPQQIIEVRSTELVSAIKTALSSDNDVKAAKILGGALKQLKLSRLKPDVTLNSSLMTLVREHPDIFSTPAVIEGLVLVLKREPSIIFKVKSNPSVYVLAAQLLLIALKDSYDWPEVVAKVYIEDALGDRVWVDLDPCKELIANICTLFVTKPYNPISSSSGGSGSVKSGEAGKSVSSEGGEGGGSCSGDVSDFGKEVPLSGIESAPRYSPSSCKSLKVYVLQVVNEQLGRHGMPADNVSRNLLKFLITSVGLSELRLFVAQKIDSWIQNPKLGKLCQELLMTVAVNCHAHSPEDVKVIETLINIRLKTKLFSSQFVSCIKELIGSHPANFATVMRGVINNELGQWRSPSNMALISMMIHSWPEEAAKLLGSIFQEFLTRKDDYLRALKGFLREVVRVIRNEFHFTAFIRSLMQERSEPEFNQMESSHKERIVHGLSDLICSASMLTANMLIREAYNGYTKGDKAMVGQLQEFFSTLGLIQRDAVWWIHSVVPTMFRPQPVDYKACLRKVLFLEGADVYSRDNWPPEADRGLIMKMMGESCLKEDTLMRVLVIGLTRELPLSPADAMDIADVLVARAANAHAEDIQRLPSIERKELFNAIFDITAYRPPANIQLPEGYQPPSLAISKLYWKGWLLLLVLSAFNPKSIGAMGWNEYPLLRGMMEMVMTNNYSFPMSMNLEVNEEGITESKEGASMKEMQLARSEKEAILEYENHLASSSGQKVITESSSYLVNQVTRLNPKGPSRKLPSSVVELIKTVNRTLRLGQLLCHCRSPDFLLSVIKRQGTAESMKWLTDLVENSHSSMEVLPVPCLCEFLMASYQDQLAGAPGTATDMETDPNSHRSHYKRKRLAKEKALERHKQLIEQLQYLISGRKSSPQSCTEVLAYFLEKLTFSHLTPRKLAINALHDILAKSTSSRRNSSNISGFPDDAEEEDYNSIGRDGERLVSCLPNVTHFVAILPQIYPFLLRACLVETNLNCLQHYLIFLTQNYPHDKLYESVIGISRLIVDRFDVIKKLLVPSCPSKPYEVVSMQGSNNLILLGSLLELFHSALEAAIHTQTMPQLASSAEFLLVTFSSVSQKAIIHTRFIQATFLLLSQGLPSGISPGDFTYLLDLWIPKQPHNSPEAFTVESKEKVSLPPCEVLQYTLLSLNERVLDLSVKEAKPSVLCKFILQFGCPVACIDKVLHRLDDLCNERAAAAVLNHCVVDPVSMAQYVEIQMLRGIKGGKHFLTFVRGLANISPEIDSVSTISEKDHLYRIGVSSFTPRYQRDLIGRVKSKSRTDSSPLIKPPLLAVLKSKKVKTGKRSVHTPASTMVETVSKACSDIEISMNPFENESALIKMSCYIIQGHSSRHLESFISTLVKRSVTLKMEKKCIRVLQNIKTAIASNCAPIAFQCNQELFADNIVTSDKESEKKVMHLSSGSPDISGLLVDVFELINPEIIHLSPDTSMRFLFSHSETYKGLISAKDFGSSYAANLLLSGQGYLLARLVNNTSWSTLVGAVQRVLDKNSVEEWINPSAVLDFLWACLHKPCLWQERVKKEAIVNSSISLGVDEDSELNLTFSQLETLVNYILKESVSYLNNRSGTPSSDDIIISPEVKSLLHSRLPLLICCCSRDQALRFVVQYLQTNTSYPSLSWQLLVHLYHANEKVIFTVDQPHPLTISALDVSTSSKLDSDLHYLISAMADAQPGQVSHMKISSAALLCRKLTLHHPALMLRQLPMLGWMLKGRAHLRPGEFRNRNHKLVFENVFTLFEMLQPLIFKDSQANSLNLCLEAFFDFMKNHCSENKKYQDIVSRFSDFLVQYSHHNREKAAGILYKNIDVLRSLSEIHSSKKSSLKSLIECFPLIPDNVDSTDPLSLMIVPPTSTSQGLTHEQVMPFLKKLENGQQREDILKVLQDLQETSLHSVDILKHFVPELCRIIQDSEPDSCKLAHDLLMRHLKHLPSAVDELLPAFIGCLESQDYTIINAAVPSLPDLLLLCKGSDANYLFRKLFVLATHSSYNCTSELIRCIEAFTQHTK